MRIADYIELSLLGMLVWILFVLTTLVTSFAFWGLKKLWKEAK